MPLHTYKCRYGHISEELYRQDEKVYGTIDCEICTEISYKQVPIIASTPAKWGDSHGYFSPDLNCYIKNSQHHDQVMDAKGLRPVTNSYEILDQATKDIRQLENLNAITDKFDRVLKETGGDIAEAVEASMPASQILDNTLPIDL